MVRSQDIGKEQVKNEPRFFVGASWSYLNADLKLDRLSNHSVWYGEDFGTYDFTREELDVIDSVIDRNNQVNNVNLEAGMVLYGRPDSKWSATATLLLGLARSYTTIHNNVTGTDEYTFDSKFQKPCAGIGMDVSYSLDPRWGISLRPFFISTFGEAVTITDNINPIPDGFLQTTSDTYRSFYQRVSLLATYTTGNLVLAAGPGFYWFLVNHEYTIERVYESNGDLLIDEITSRSVNRSFIDGTVAVKWHVSGPVNLYAIAGIGNDIVVNAGITLGF
jgi:hypothetical protein